MNNSNQHTILVKKAAKGNEAAFRQLYQLYKHNLFTVCLRYAKSRTHAQDYLQDAFVNIYKALGQFDDQKGSLYTWMKRITINVCLADLRKGTLYYVSINEAYNLESNDNDILSQLSLKEMLGVIQQLPPGYRTIFNMYVIDGYTHREIAEDLGITISTSKSQLMKARNLLKKKILTSNKRTHQHHG